MENMYFWPKVW